MSIKPYLYLIYRKKVKFVKRLTRYLNICKDHLYPKPLYKPPQHKSHNEENALGKN